MFIIYLLISKFFKLFIVLKKIFLEIIKFFYFCYLYFLWYVFIILFKMYVDKK